jgi:hypothetical protein
VALGWHPGIRPPRTETQPRTGTKRTAMNQNKAKFNSPAEKKNSSSLFFYRLTQYYAFRSTMYCKVPFIYRIFVMQTESNQTKKPKYMSRSINQLSRTIFNGSKKIALAVALLLTVGISSSFANPTEGHNDAVNASFHKDFKKAELLTTEPGKNYTKLTFKMNDMVLSAFYGEDGQLLAVTRNIRSNQLPIQLLLQIKKDYTAYWISDLFEFSSDGSSAYYITLENADSKVTLRSSGSDTWEVYTKKTKE